MLHGHTFDVSHFICDVNIKVYAIDMYSVWIQYVAYICNLVGIFDSDIYFIITSQVDVAVGCGLVYMCSNHCFLSSYSISAMYMYVCNAGGIFIQLFIVTRKVVGLWHS